MSTNVIQSTFGERLHTARINSLHSDAFDFSTRVGISIDALFAIEQGKIGASRAHIDKFAEIADVSADWLLNGDCNDLASKTLALIQEMSELNLRTGNPQNIYVTEECSELIKELMKDLRKKPDKDALIDESCDVLLTTLTMLYQHNVGWDCVLEHFEAKINRAKTRIENGEI